MRSDLKRLDELRTQAKQMALSAETMMWKLRERIETPVLSYSTEDLSKLIICAAEAAQFAAGAFAEAARAEAEFVRVEREGGI